MVNVSEFEEYFLPQNPLIVQNHPYCDWLCACLEPGFPVEFFFSVWFWNFIFPFFFFCVDSGNRTQVLVLASQALYPFTYFPSLRFSFCRLFIFFNNLFFILCVLVFCLLVCLLEGVRSWTYG